MIFNVIIAIFFIITNFSTSNVIYIIDYTSY